MNFARPIVSLVVTCLLATFIGHAQKPCAPSRHAKLPAITELTYHKARTRLLAAGWQPLQTIHHNSANTNINTAYGNGQIFWKKGYWEVELCSGTGLAACSFLFTDAYRNRLRIVTLGEELLKPRSYARVRKFSFVCGEED